MPIKITTEQLWNDNHTNILICPVCGEGFLHHEIIEIFARTEDAKKGLHVIQKGTDQLKIDTVLEGNPSLRRDGINIKFSCEHCGREPILTIAQHKGQTIMGWD